MMGARGKAKGGRGASNSQGCDPEGRDNRSVKSITRKALNNSVVYVVARPFLVRSIPHCEARANESKPRFRKSWDRPREFKCPCGHAMNHSKFVWPSGSYMKTRKARLTYGVRSNLLYYESDPKHVKRRPIIPIVGDDDKERIPCFSKHITVGDDIPVDCACPTKRYTPLRKTITSIGITVLASYRKDVRFPEKDTTFPLGKVTVPMNMATDYDDRRVGVKFAFGGTEFSVHCFDAATGAEVGNVSLELMQEAIKAG